MKWGLWPFAIAFAFLAIVSFQTTQRHRDDVAYMSIGGREFCAEAADCETSMSPWLFGEIEIDYSDLDSLNEEITLRAIECRASDPDPGVYCRQALEEIHGYPSFGRFSMLSNPFVAATTGPLFGILAAGLGGVAVWQTLRSRRSSPAEPPPSHA